MKDTLSLLIQRRLKLIDMIERNQLWLDKVTDKEYKKFALEEAVLLNKHYHICVRQINVEYTKFKDRAYNPYAEVWHPNAHLEMELKNLSLLQISEPVLIKPNLPTL